MTITELCDCSAEQLKKMTDAELLQHFQQYLIVTRPELAPRQTQRTTPEPMSEKKKSIMQLLAAQDVDVSLLLKRKKK